LIKKKDQHQVGKHKRYLTSHSSITLTELYNQTAEWSKFQVGQNMGRRKATDSEVGLGAGHFLWLSKQTW